MPLIKLVPEEQAEGKLLDLYETERRTVGYVPNYTKAFSLRPDVYEIWGQLDQDNPIKDALPAVRIGNDCRCGDPWMYLLNAGARSGAP